MRASSSALFALLGVATSACSSAPAPAQMSGARAPAYAPAWSYAPPPPAAPPIVQRPVNVFALQGLTNRCAPQEVAPGTWASFDCGVFRDILRALPLPRRMSLTTGPLPTVIDHRTDASEGPVKSQGAVGACTAFSLSTAMDHAVRRMGRGDVVSPLHVWSKYAVPEMGTAGDQTVDQTLTLEPSWPYDPAKACELTRDPTDDCGRAYGVAAASGDYDPRLRAERAAADATGRYRLLAVEKLQARPADPSEIAAVLAGGDDVWASFSVSNAAWNNQSLRGAVIPDYVPDGDTGHAVVLAGYRTLADGTRQFLVHNSWGNGWGEQGYGWLSEAMVVTNLRAGYKVRVADASVGPLPAPDSSGCPAGQVKDAVLGTCAALCSSGSPPSAGVCLPSLPGFPAPGQLPSGPLPFPLPFPLPQPGQQPAQTACPQGQATDLMTGQCAALCPNGAPALGGMCLPFGR